MSYLLRYGRRAIQNVLVATAITFNVVHAMKHEEWDEGHEDVDPPGFLAKDYLYDRG